ncbi:MAG: cupin domain-containing protein [Halioglobus sp.]|nr:cupin domain-containing protein [Halioglobus sp.]
MTLLIRLIFFVAAASVASATWSIEASEKVSVTPVLKTQKNWYGDQIVYPPGKAEATVVVVEIAPGGATGWHSHPVPSFGMVMEGAIEVEFENGEVKHLSAGEAAAEAVNVWHNGHNRGEVSAKLVVFYAGATDEPLTVQKTLSPGMGTLRSNDIKRAVGPVQ